MTDIVRVEPAFSAQPAVPPASVYRFTFHGRGGEYFGIWIVNLLLSVLTLGIYSAWAKVRTQRYFHGATELDGSRFGYHGTPKAILIGRIVAIALFLPYVIVSKINPIIGAILLLAGLSVVPWLIMRASRFRLRVTSYRNIRFGFGHAPGVLKSAYIRFLLLPILALPTIGLILPYAQHQRLAWLVNNSRFGTTPLRAQPGVKEFYLAYLALLATVIAVGVVFGILTTTLGILMGAFVQTAAHVNQKAAIAIVMVPFGLFFYLGLIATAQAYGAWFHKLIYDRISLGNITVAAHYDRWDMVKLFVTNLLMLIFTLGFAYPWVRCRTARYMLGQLELTAPDGLDHFVAASAQDVSAIGDQVASMFDVDIGIGF